MKAKHNHTAAFFVAALCVGFAARGQEQGPNEQEAEAAAETQIAAADDRQPTLAIDPADDQEKAQLVTPGRNLRLYVSGDAEWSIEQADDSNAFRADFLLEEAIAEDGPILGDATVSASGEGVEQRWENTPRGVEHTLVVSQPLAPGELLLTLHVAGLMPQALDDTGVSLIDTIGNSVAYYKEMRAYDAAGQDLDAFMSVDDNAILLHVDVNDAEWPVTIDPITSTAVTRNGSAAHQGFGQSIATGQLNPGVDSIPDVVIGMSAFDVGVNPLDDSGGFRVFRGTTSGIEATQFLERDGAVSGAGMGETVAVGDVNGDGFDDIIVASSFESSPGNTNDGRIRVFLNDASGLGNFPSTASATVLDANFDNCDVGASLNLVVANVDNTGPDDIIARCAIHPQTVMIWYGVATTGPSGGPSHTTSDVGTGSGGQGLAVGFVTNDTIPDIAIPGSTSVRIFAGASSPRITLDPSVDTHQDPSVLGGVGGPSLVAALADIDGDGFDDLITGDRDFDNGTTLGGRLATFLNNGSGVIDDTLVQADIRPTGTTGFGEMVAAHDVNGDGLADVVVGAPEDATDVGRIKLFSGKPGIGIETAGTRLSVAGAHAGEFFGAPLGTVAFGALSNDGADDLIAGAPSFGVSSTDGTGRVEVFDGDLAGLKSTNFQLLKGGSTNAHMGDSNSSYAVGDINQDGIDDLVIGAGDAGSTNGKVFVFQGGASMSATPVLTITASGADIFGKSVAIGHFRGPSNPPSIAVGEVEFDSPITNAGKVWIFNAPSNGFPSATTTAGADDSLPAPASQTNFGWSLANCGNLVDSNGDCLAVGSDLKGANGGVVTVFKAKSDHSGLDHTAAASKTGASNGTGVSCSSGFGAFVANAGNVENVTGDGGNRSDLLVGDPDCSDGHSGEGKAFLYTGVSGGSLTASTWTFEVNQRSAALGPVAGLGDVTGDGVADFAVGAPLVDNVGCALVNISDGSGSTVTATVASSCTAVAGQTIAIHDANVGATYNGTYTVSTVTVVGANKQYVMTTADPGSDNDPDVANTGTMFTVVDAGRVYVFKGKTSGTPSTTQTVSMSTTFSGHCGTSIAGGVDINRDGFMDMIEGEPSYDNGVTDQGRVRVFFGKTGTMDTVPATTIVGGTSGLSMGQNVAVGNFDGTEATFGNTYGDVVIGVPFFTGSFSQEGEAIIRVGQW